MNRIHWMLALGAMIVLSTSALVMSADEMKERAAPATKPSSARLFTPYSRMTSLTDEQKTKIRDIHKDVLAEIRKINEKQAADIAALLTDEQKKELKELEEKASADAKKAPAKEGAD